MPFFCKESLNNYEKMEQLKNLFYGAGVGYRKANNLLKNPKGPLIKISSKNYKVLIC